VLGLVLALSVAGLAVGPLLYASGRGRASAVAALDGLTLGLVPPLIMLRLAPHIYDEIGNAAPPLFAAGYAFVWLVDRRGHDAHGARLASAVVVSALVVHALGDGATLAVALRSTEHVGGGTVFAFALLLHRLPEGLVITRAVVPTLGWPAAIGRLALMACATLVGALAGSQALEALPEGPVEGLVAFGLGALLRWVAHAHETLPAGRTARTTAGLAFACGLALALALPTPHSLLERAQPRELALAESLWPLFVECAPALLAGALLSSALGALFRAFARGRRHGPLFGLAAAWRLEPTAHVLALSTRLGAASRSAGAVATWALASAALQVDVLLVGARLLGPPWALARALVTVATATGVGALVAVVGRPRFDTSAKENYPRNAPQTPLRWHPRDAGSVFARAAPGLLTGLLLAALAEAALRPSPTASTPGLDPLARWSLIAGLSLGGRVALPLAAVAVHKGFSPGLALGLLSLRLAAWPAALPAIVRQGGAFAAGAFVVGTAGASWLAGFAIDRALSPASVPEVHPLVAHHHHPLEWVAAAAAAAWLLIVLLRRGPRRWLRDLFAHSLRYVLRVPRRRATGARRRASARARRAASSRRRGRGGASCPARPRPDRRDRFCIRRRRGDAPSRRARRPAAGR
jgi:uncharacterized protein